MALRLDRNRPQPTFPIWPPLIGRILHLLVALGSKFFAAWVAHRDDCSSTRIVAGALDMFADTSPVLRPLFAQTVSGNSRPLAGRHRQRPDPPEHRREQPPRQVTFRQQKPVIAGVLD